jgi:hypothetical protein
MSESIDKLNRKVISVSFSKARGLVMNVDAVYLKGTAQ